MAITPLALASFCPKCRREICIRNNCLQISLPRVSSNPIISSGKGGQSENNELVRAFMLPRLVSVYNVFLFLCVAVSQFYLFASFWLGLTAHIHEQQQSS